MRAFLSWAALWAVCVASFASAQDFTWQDVVQRVAVEPDGSVVVYDERTLTTDEDFGDAFICLNLGAGQTVTLLEGGARSPGPDATALQQPCEDGSGGTELVVRQAARVAERRVFFRYRLGAPQTCTATWLSGIGISWKGSTHRCAGTI